MIEVRLERLPIPASGLSPLCEADDHRCGRHSLARVANAAEIGREQDIDCPTVICSYHVWEWEPALDAEARLDFATIIADEADTQRGLG